LRGPLCGISGSRLNHCFPDEESLVCAVLAWRADGYVRRTDVLDGGCGFGSPSEEVMKTGLDVHADIDRLAHTLMAAFQGGMLLADHVASYTAAPDGGA
jgi:hypothetical protein